MKISSSQNVLQGLSKNVHVNRLENIDESSKATEKKKEDGLIRFDINESEEQKSYAAQSTHKFSELDLIAMLKKQGLSVQMILEILKRIRLEKEKDSDVAISVRGTNDKEKF
ncbi:DUF3914 domain-containing protein [Bacillus sp. S13(2024)]|uniref:DUF3914 domain-containing protein n=1 Tax=unclassified Bacillus (in: firmicutes) TaxID=185979 RepID=UPI003D1A6097